MKIAFLFFAFCLTVITAQAQLPSNTYWTKDGNGYYALESNEIVLYQLPSLTKKTVVAKQQLTLPGTEPIQIKRFFFSNDFKKILIYTNSKKVWRYETRGDYWVLNLENNGLQKLGKDKPPSSLMFAKFSPDAKNVAYVSNYNIYVENLATKKITAITKNGTRQLINGTFDWAYEEEFFCRDGFRWSPDSKKIAFWEILANNTKNYMMLNTTDSIYPKVIPVEYPVAGEKPSSFKIGVADIVTAKTKWMNIPTDPVLESYVPRMEWADNNSQLIIQHLSRKQNVSDVMLCDIATGGSKTIFHETDDAWIDILGLWDADYYYGGWDWLRNGKEFVWASEKDGWRHLYRIGIDGKNETLITKGNYDVMQIDLIDEMNGYVYFDASPENATQKYLYRTKLDGSGTPERITPSNQRGTHDYHLSPNGAFAQHSFSNYFTPNVSEWVSLPSHDALDGHKVFHAVEKADSTKSNMQFFKIKTSEGVEMDGWMAKPTNFDSSKKYPVVFYVYTEPWGQTAPDKFGVGHDFLYKGDMAKDGYIYVSIDNRGTPVPKGRAWRKSVYKKIGLVNIKDQAMAAQEVLKWPFIDTSRVAVWGWSGGGSATLNLMFQYPDIYKTGIAIAAVGNQLTYDNIYQERYMGLPEENRQDFVNGSPITYAKNLKGNLLYIHGTGDDNVHYANAEMLINELVKYNKQFQLMSYPNRTHSISEGAGTFNHLSTLYTNFLRQYCPSGPK